ncbi:MAG: hypothetical protein CVU39_13445 [Chloroflexi bacterium HGW-Chloroflexi-10]|nr:MAG: hypothetical protein CVU39_13445 [Chloroflexi bacterium HGW-Chloroflexi-10]
MVLAALQEIVELAMNKKIILLAVLFFSLFFVGCSRIILNNHEQGVSTTKTLVETKSGQTPTILIKTTVVQTTPPTQDFTNTPTLIPPPSVTPSPYPSLTALATLTNNDANRMVFDLIKTNGDCEMPCIWGIVPGETKWEVVKQQFSALRFEFIPYPYKCIDETKHECTTYYVGKIINDLHYGFEVSVEDENITDVSIRSQSAKGYFSLDKVLNEFEIPSDIYINAPTAYISSNLPAYIVLFYDTQNLAISYEIRGKVFNNVLRICPYNYETDLRVNVYEPNSPYYMNYKKYFTDRKYYPIEEKTGLDISDFYELFVNKAENNCLDLKK